MSKGLRRHATHAFFVVYLAACGQPSTPEKPAQASPAPSQPAPIYGPWTWAEPTPPPEEPPPPEPVIVPPVLPPDSVYGEWVVRDIRGEKGSLLDKEEAAAWVGSRLRVTKDLIKLADPPKGIRRLDFPDYPYAEDVVNTCTKATYRTDLEHSASDLSFYRDVYRHFRMRKPTDPKIFLLECNPDENNEPDEDGHVAEVSREEVFGPFLLFSYAPDALFLVWGSGQIVRFQKIN